MLIIIKTRVEGHWANTKDFTINYIPKGYSYHDYRMAWYRAFLYRPFDHSWFFTFHSNCQEEFPIWFYGWWHSYRPTTDILPSTVLKGFNLYLLKARGLHYKRQYSSTENSRSHGSYAGATKLLNITVLLINSQ